MAFSSAVSRVVEIIVKLTDKVSAPAKKIENNLEAVGGEAADSLGRVENEAKGAEKAIESLGDEAKDSLDKVDKEADEAADSIGAISGTLARVGSAIAVFATAAAAAFVAVGAATNNFAQRLALVQRSAQSLSTTVEVLSELRFAAEQTGVPIQALEVSLRNMTKRIGDAARGFGEGKRTLDLLGLSAQELSELSIEDRLAAIADAMQGVAEGAEKDAALLGIFGEQGLEISRILEDGSVGLNKYADELAELDAQLKTTSGEGAVEFVQSVNKIGVAIRGALQPVGNFFVDIGNDLFRATGVADESLETLNARLKALQSVLKTVEENPPLFGRQETIDDFLEKIREVEDAIQELEQTQSDIANNKAIQQSLFIRNKVFQDADDERIEIEKETQKELDRLRKQELAAQEAAVRQYTKNREIFNRLQQEVVSPAKLDDVNILDVAEQIAKANQALAAGDSQAALETSKKAGELLIDLKENGEVAGLVLQGLAKKIRDLGLEASKEIAVEEITVDFTANTDPVQAVIQELQATPVSVPVVFVPTNNPNDVIYNEMVQRGDNG